MHLAMVGEKEMGKAVLKQLRVNSAWCKGCGICVAFCPKQVLALDDCAKAVVERVGDCIACGLCERMCPDLAITVESEPEPVCPTEA